jgi:hypothetical protein
MNLNGTAARAVLLSSAAEMPLTVCLYITLPHITDPLYAHCAQAQAAAVARVLEQRANAAEELAALTTDTRRRLGLRRLARDGLVNPDQYAAACKRLNHHREALLAVHVDGLSVRISDANRMQTDSEWIDIAWDFEL